MAAYEQQLNPCVYIWMGVSVLLNTSGMASIVDGLVVWEKPFGEFVIVYRMAIQEPSAYVVQLIWPFTVPRWVFDAFAIWSGFLLATIISIYRHSRMELFREIGSALRDRDVPDLLRLIFSIVIAPIIIFWVSIIYKIRIHRAMLYFVWHLVFVVNLFIFMIVLNSQLNQHGM